MTTRLGAATAEEEGTEEVVGMFARLSVRAVAEEGREDRPSDLAEAVCAEEADGYKVCVETMRRPPVLALLEED